MLTFLGLVTPLAFVLVGVEWFVTKMKKKDYYQFADTVANLSLGMSERLFDFFYAIILLFFFQWVHTNFAIFEVPENVLTWILCLLIYDFVHYWYHRFGHESNILWAIHIIHHQSEEYNYSVSARVSGVQVIPRTIFMSILPLIGFAPEFSWSVFIVTSSYQYFLHTRLIGKLGILEYIFVTPSLHRVHHGRNEKYLDKNYGGIFIWWDMLFGTYQKEEEEVKYGITKELKSKNVYWAMTHQWVAMFKQTKNIPNWWDKIKYIIVKGPAWKNHKEKYGEMDDEVLNRPKYNPTAPLRLSIYVFLQLVICMLIVTSFLMYKGSVTGGDYGSIEAFYTEVLTPLELFIFSLLTILGTLTVPVLLEKKVWVYYVEHIRLALTMIGTLILIYPALFNSVSLSFDFSALPPSSSWIIALYVLMVFWLYQVRYSIKYGEVVKQNYRTMLMRIKG